MRASMLRDAELVAHAFCEGDDDQDYYYGYLANHFVGRFALETYICNGKEEVITARGLMTRNRPDLASLFFVDADYERYVGQDSTGPSTYVTDYYSVESYMALPSHIDVIARTKCLLDSQISSHDSVRTEFPAKFSIFCSAMKRTCATMIWLRVRNEVAHFKMLKMSLFGHIDQSGSFFPKHADSTEILLSAIGKPGLVVDSSEVDAIEERLGREDPLLWVRGKFVLEFVADYFRRRVDGLRAKKVRRSDGRHVRSHTCLSPSAVTLCGEVGGTAPAVATLSRFLATF